MTDRFSLNNTIDEVMNGAGPQLPMFFHESLLQFVPEEYRDAPLHVLKEKVMMPWGVPFPADDLVRDANNVDHAEELWELIPLWTETRFQPGTGSAENVCLMKLRSCEMDGIRPCVIICPGGGYENIAFYGEGIVTAERCAKEGIRPFILNYRFRPNHYPAPQMDLALAIAHLRANAGKYQIDPDDLMILGYSAGGHLCASTVAHRQEIRKSLLEELEKTGPELAARYANVSIRPDKVVLCYPVISFSSEAHEPSFQALTGGDESLREYLSVEKQVDADYPPTFIWTNADDTLVPPSNTERMGEALTAKDVLHKMRIYPQGEHGCSLGTGTSAEGWFDEMTEFFTGGS